MGKGGDERYAGDAQRVDWSGVLTLGLQRTITLQTRSQVELVDLTDFATVTAASSTMLYGVLHLFCPHTTCGLVINELEDGLHQDLTAFVERVVPAEQYYAHDDLARRWQNLTDAERPNGHSHLRAMLLTQPSLMIPVASGTLCLGRWQRAFLLEFDGARERTVYVSAIPLSDAPTRSKERAL